MMNVKNAYKRIKMTKKRHESKLAKSNELVQELENKITFDV